MSPAQALFLGIGQPVLVNHRIVSVVSVAAEAAGSVSVTISDGTRHDSKDVHHIDIQQQLFRIEILLEELVSRG
jgi:hypothetical protein